MTPTPTYCPICGELLTTREEGGRIRPACDHCGYIHYINPVPGVGIIIEMNGGVVLVQRGHPPHEGRWTLPGGFVEADESAEEAAIRETKEETGLQVELIELAGINSFPEGPPVSGIMIFYRARVIGGKLEAGDDAVDVRLFKPDELPRMPFRTHREMMAQWMQAYKGNGANEISRDESKEANFAIRLLEPKDMHEVLALLALIPANRNFTHDEWNAIALRLNEMNDIVMFVAVTDDSKPIIVGCIVLSVVRSATEGIGLINDMAVLPTYQRQGIGAALLEAVIRRANQLNLRSIWVNSERANDQARAFYDALGFGELDLMQLRIRR